MDETLLHKTGIYRILNKTNGRFYMGSTEESFTERWREHKWRLCSNTHHNPSLQAAWNKYGENIFEFQIVLLCDPDNCLHYEQLFLDKYWDNGIKCYNAGKKADAPMKGRKHTEATRKKISEKKSGENHPNYGKHLKPETALSIRKQNTKRRNTTGYVGVQQQENGRWISHISIRGKQIYLGTFDTPEEGEQIYQDALMSYMADPDTQIKRKEQLHRKNKSGYTGVGWKKQLNKWIARIMIDRKQIHLGVFDSLEDAIQARKEAEETLRDKL